MLSDALRAPGRSDDAAGTLLVGGLLLLFSLVFPLLWVYAVLQSVLWLVLGPIVAFPPLVALGYDVRVLEAGARDDAEAPSIVDWTGLVRTGILSLVVRAAYLLPLALVVVAGGALAFGLRSGAFGLSTERASLVVAGVGFLVGLFTLAYLAAYLYLRPAALTVLAVTGRVRESLSPRRTLGVALTADYAAGWIVAGTVLLLGLAIALPFQLLLVGFAIAFYVRTAAYVAYGRGARDALLSRGLVGETAADREPTIPVGRPAPAAVQVGRDVGISTGTRRDLTTGESSAIEPSTIADPDRIERGRDSGFDFGTDRSYTGDGRTDEQRIDSDHTPTDKL